MSGQNALVRSSEVPVSRPVSQPQDIAEREADRIADRVSRGGSVADWSFANTPVAAPGSVLRQEASPKPEEEKKEPPKLTPEPLPETDPGKKLKAEILANPTVQKLKTAVTTPGGLVVGGAMVAGGLAALAASGKALPFQSPPIPIRPGLTVQPTLLGPVNAPTQVGLTITFEPQGDKDTKKSDPIAADTARLKALDQMFKPASQKAAEKREQDELIRALAKRGGGLMIPLTPETTKKTEDPKKEEQTPVQPTAASVGARMPRQANVEAALVSPGRPLEPATRRHMEGRFGHDFSRVRIYDDSRSASVAASINSAAFTVGPDIVSGSRGLDRSSGAVERRLLAHELAHVVQGNSQSVVRRQTGSWSTTETVGR